MPEMKTVEQNGQADATEQQLESQQTPEQQQDNAPDAAADIEAQIDQAFKSRDKAKQEELRKLLFENAGEEPKREQKADEKATESGKPPETEQPAATVPAKRFSVKYKGSPIDVDDPDGLLGFGNVGALKKSKIHQDLYIKDLEDGSARSRSLLAQREKEIEDLRKRFADAEAQLKRQPAPRQDPAPQPAQPKLERPAPPDMPDIPDDPTDWTEDHQKLHKKYLAELRDYPAKLAEYTETMVRSSQAQPQQPTKVELPPEIAAELEEVRTVKKTLEEQKRKLEEEKRESEYWDGSIRTFQNHHKQYATKAPIREVHTQVMSWMDKLATANGIQKPDKPFSSQDVEWITYERRKGEITHGYLNGDQGIRENAEGITPPPEYETYFKLAGKVQELTRLKDEYVGRGELGPNVNLHKVYLHHLDETGQLDEDINDLRATERTKGAEAITNALREHQQFATAIPPEASQTDGLPGDLTDDDIAWFYAQSPHTVMRNSDAKARYNKIGKALGF